LIGKIGLRGLDAKDLATLLQWVIMHIVFGSKPASEGSELDSVSAGLALIDTEAPTRATRTMNEVLFLTEIDHYCYRYFVGVESDSNCQGWWRNGSAL
jgi:hypothetical protein